MSLSIIVTFLLGAAIGSFLNVCIYRLPKGASIVYPPSSCPSCNSKIAFYDNIPIISYLVLRGRCRSCGASISMEYPVVEALTGVMAAVLFSVYGASTEFFIYFIFACALVVITFIDLRHRIIPDVISLPGIAAGFAASFVLPSIDPVTSLIGIAAGGGTLLLVAVLYYKAAGIEGMGGGDIKLLAMIGAFLGWKGVLLTLVFGSVLGAAVGALLMALFGKDTKYAIPFGPFLSAGALVYLFYGDPIIGWYLNTVLPR